MSSRRRVLNWIIGGASLLIASVVAVPSLVAAFSPAVRGARRGKAWQSLGALSAFPPGAVVKTVVAPVAAAPHRAPAQAVYVWRNASGETVVFSRACTDLGCPVNYDPGSTFYFCPCHGGIFNTSGEPVAGPPARPLYRYATRVRDGMLEIDVSSVPAVA